MAVRGVGRGPGGKVGGEGHSSSIQVPFLHSLGGFHMGSRCCMMCCHGFHNKNSFDVVWATISRWYWHDRGKSTSRVGMGVQNFLPSDVHDTRAIFVCWRRSVVYTAHAPVYILPKPWRDFRVSMVETGRDTKGLSMDHIGLVLVICRCFGVVQCGIYMFIGMWFWEVMILSDFSGNEEKWGKNVETKVEKKLV